MWDWEHFLLQGVYLMSELETDSGHPESRGNWQELVASYLLCSYSGYVLWFSLPELSLENSFRGLPLP